MNKRVTISDIARELGVSTTTVNSALKGKGRVSEEKKQLVIAACKRLNYKPNKNAMSLPRKPIKIGVIIDSKIPEFHNELIRGAESARADLEDFNVYGEFIVYSLPNARLPILAKMKEMGASDFDGIIVCPSNDMREYDVTIQELYSRNIPVVTIVSDIPDSKRAFSVQSDGRLSGKIVAELLWWFSENKNVAIFTGYKDRGIHANNIEGFIEETKKKPLNVIAIYENQDDPEIAYYATDKLLREYPEIGGIYICTANSSTVCKRIMELGLQGKIKVIASDIFPNLNNCLKDGIVHATIFQDPFTQGRLAFKYLYEFIADGKRFDDVIQIRPEIVLESNLESFCKDQ